MIEQTSTPSVDPAPNDAHLSARRSMVHYQLRSRGILDERVLAVMSRLPREQFVPVGDQAAAYDDQAMPIEAGQTISQPYMVALMSEILEVSPHHRLLEIGTGSGYQTAVLACLAQHVYSIERLAALTELAEQRLRSLHLDNITLKVGDGTLGWPEAAPFNGIIVTAGAPSIPPALVDQLADGARLVVPVGGESHQTLTVIQRQGRTTIERPGIACRFVPLIGKAGWRSRDESDR